MSVINHSAKLTLVLNQPNCGIDFDFEITIKNDSGLKNILQDCRNKGLTVVDLKTDLNSWSIIEKFGNDVSSAIESVI